MSKKSKAGPKVKYGADAVSGLSWWQTVVVVVCFAVLVAVLFVSGDTGQKLIVAVSAVGGLIVILIPGNTLHKATVIAVMTGVAVAGAAYLAVRWTWNSYRSIDVTSMTTLIPEDREIGPGGSVTMSVRLPSSRRYLAVTFGWRDSAPAAGGCGVDLQLTISGAYGYPAAPLHVVHIGAPVKVDLGSPRKNVVLDIQLADRDPACRGTLYVKHSQASLQGSP